MFDVCVSFNCINNNIRMIYPLNIEIFIFNMINECIIYTNMGLHRKLREYGLKKNRQWRFLLNFKTLCCMHGNNVSMCQIRMQHAWEQCLNIATHMANRCCWTRGMLPKNCHWHFFLHRHGNQRRSGAV